MRKLILMLFASAIAVSAALTTFEHVASAPAASAAGPAATTLEAAGIDPATMQKGTTATGVTIFTAQRSDGAACAGFGEAVICPKPGEANLFADGPIVTIAISRLLRQAKEGAFALGPTQRVIGFLRDDVKSITVTLPNGNTQRLEVRDHAFEYAGAVASIRALDQSGSSLGTASPTGS